MNKTCFLKFKKVYALLLMMMVVVGFSSCQDDDNEIYNNLIGYTWIGDLGFNVGPYPVESGITFKGNDYAIDRQYYFAENGGGPAVTLELTWWIDNGNLYLDYGSRYPMLQIRNVFVGNTYLSGPLFENGSYVMDVRLDKDF